MLLLDSIKHRITSAKPKRRFRKISISSNKEASNQHNFVNQETISALQEEIEYLWSLYRIDKYYQKAYYESLSNVPITAYIQFLAKEIENLYNEKSTIQQLYSAICKREEQLHSIKNLEPYLEEGKVNHTIIDNVNNVT